VFPLSLFDSTTLGFYYACLFISLASNVVIFYFRRKDREIAFNASSFVGDLLADYWFDSFISRKLVSLGYFGWCVFSLSLVIFGVVRIPAFILIGIVYWILGRVGFELLIALVKLAENTSTIIRILRNIQQQSIPPSHGLSSMSSADHKDA
jgi:hypothetical protein